MADGSRSPETFKSDFRSSRVYLSIRISSYRVVGPCPPNEQCDFITFPVRERSIGNRKPYNIEGRARRGHASNVENVIGGR